MQKITFVIDEWLKKDLKEYLLSLKGVLDVNIDFENNKIDIQYDERIINNYMIKGEINLFLNRQYPSIIRFDKYGNNTKQLDITSDICCENCYLNLIDKLYDIDGISKVSSDFEFGSGTHWDTNFSIVYDEKKIDKKKIISIIENYH